MSEEQPTFKVTDRRLFNADGTPRDLPPEETARPSAIASDVSIESDAASQSSATAPERAPEPIETSAPDEEAFDEGEIEGADDPASFVNFAMSLASNAASALGMMEHPVTHKREVDLEFA